jgi:hypothetical protein
MERWHLPPDFWKTIEKGINYYKEHLHKRTADSTDNEPQKPFGVTFTTIRNLLQQAFRTQSHIGSDNFLKVRISRYWLTYVCYNSTLKRHQCRADRDLWMKAETCPDDGVLYWAYILIYVDDIFCVHHDPGSPLAKLDEYFKMKGGSIQVPTFYLGAKLNKTVMPNGVVAWGMSSSKFVQSAVQNVKEYMVALPGDQKLMKKAFGPFAGGYKPELDESPELDPTRANFYQSQIGILR